MYKCNDANERLCCGTTSSRRKHVIDEGNCCFESSICNGERPSLRLTKKFGKCQCVAEACWERCSPPRPKRDWANNFHELRRRWSEHAKRQNCPCDDCKRKTIQPLEDSRQICRNEKKEHFDDNDVDDGYRSSSNRDARRRCSHESRFEKSPRSCSDEKFAGYCLCQPRCCAVRIDARSHPECNCECLTTVECPCPPNERRFPRSTKCCVVTESCDYPDVKSKSSCLKIPSERKRNSCSTPQGSRGIVGLISFTLLILVAVAWTINVLLQSMIPRAQRTTRCRRRMCRFF